MMYLQLSKPRQDGEFIEATAHCQTVAEQCHLLGIIKAGFDGEIFGLTPHLAMVDKEPQEFSFFNERVLIRLLDVLLDQHFAFCLSTENQIEFSQPVGPIQRLGLTKLFLSSDFISDLYPEERRILEAREAVAIRCPDNWVWRKIVPSELKRARRQL